MQSISDTKLNLTKIPFQTILDFGSYQTQSLSIPKLSFDYTSRNNISLRCVNSKLFSAPPHYLTNSKVGLITNKPELCEEGTGGTYFLKNTQNVPIAVFKPRNEEPMCSQNPKKKLSNNDFHFKGFTPGEGASREVLAYQLDNSFAGVPETHLVQVSHWIFTDKEGTPGSPTSGIKVKEGSSQEFIPDVLCSVDDMGYSKFSVGDVQKIAIFDMLLANCDRNGGNILVRKNSYKLVPIDHAFCLPDYQHLSSDLQWFEWLTWKQVKQAPIPEVISFIEKFNIDAAVKKANALNISKGSILTLQLTHTFLKVALKQNLTLYEIAKLMCSSNSPSLFSKLVTNAVKANRSSASHEVIISSFVSLLTKHFA